MSMMDETPSYFIKEGYIYSHTPATHYRSCGFNCGDPAYDTKICEATPYNINKYIENHGGIYNYDTHTWEKKYVSNYIDAFAKHIYKGSKVMFMDCDCTGTFLGYVKGIVDGFTKEYVYIRPIEYDRINRWHTDIPVFKRTPHRIIVIDEL